MEENKYYNYDNSYGRNIRNKSKFWSFVLSFMPGAGHMYLGLLKQGVQLMSVFLGIIGISTLLNLGAICFILPILWFYGIFDATEKCAQGYSNKDENLEIINWIYKGSFNYKIDRKLVGYGLLIVSGLIILNNIIMPIFSIVFDTRHWFITSLINYLIVASLLLWGGYKLVKSGEKIDRDFSDEDFQEYERNITETIIEECKEPSKEDN